ncbi:MAG: hypothetical protein CL916_14085 [Deltaproteobacteria bacterium]|nr:hypothetical protein [Deltaproteobacteria bacterium]
MLFLFSFACFTGGSNCNDDFGYYQSQVSDIVESKCLGCHSADGLANTTRLKLQSGDDEGNFEQLSALAKIQTEDGFLLWNKPTGQHEMGHVGGEVLAEQSNEALVISKFIGMSNDLVETCSDEFIIEAQELICDDNAYGKRLLRRLSHQEFDNTIEDLFGIDSDWGSKLPKDNVVDGYRNNAVSLQVFGGMSELYMMTMEDIADTVVSERLNTIVPCSAGNRTIACAEEFLLDFGTHIFRRPLNDDEVSDFLSLFSDVYYDDGFEEGMKWTLTAMLQSPHFLYRSELGVQNENGDFQLTSWEIASELSYLIWQTTPNRELLDLAEQDVLQDRGEVLSQAYKMMNHPKASNSILEMTNQWLGIENLSNESRGSVDDPLSVSVKEDMVTETNRLMMHAYSENMLYSDLLVSNASIINSNLAGHYGVEIDMSQVDADGFAHVEFGSEQYGGLLRQGAVLTKHTLPSNSSPVLRGAFIRERILCQELPPPPPNVSADLPQVAQDISNREKYEAHTTNTECSSCHNLMDPVGFGFEHYDELGRWRDQENGFEIDDEGVVFNIDKDDVPFSGVEGVADVLAGSEQVGECYVQQWFTFGYGEGNREDKDIACAVQAASDLYFEQGETMQAPILSLIQLERFFMRKGEAEEGDTMALNSVVELKSDEIEESYSGDSEDSVGEDTQDGVVVSYEDTSWGSAGYHRVITVKNVSLQSLSWTISYEHNGSTVIDWNGFCTQQGAIVHCEGDELQSGESVEVGYGVQY